MPDVSKLVQMRIVNIGPIGPEGITIDLDNIVSLVGANNSGKSTVLRAYEVALGTKKFAPENDLCTRAPERLASVEIWVHIPPGIANIADKWKTKEGDLLLVRSRWEWSEANSWAPNRQTWDPELDAYSTDDKASGLDTVFNSRLPQPFRIGTLEDPDEEHKKLLTLILQPIADRLKVALGDTGSPLFKALSEFNTQAQVPVEAEAKRFDSLKEELNRAHNAIFPELAIDLEIGLGDIDIDPVKLLLRSSHIKFVEWAEEIDWTKQGTGSQRALFWTMLQARSRLNAIANVVQQTAKDIANLEKQVAKLRKEAEKAKKDETKQKKEEQITECEKSLSMLRSSDPEKVIQDRGADLALPGYMLLIDEPEVGLHPNAIRAACNYLYSLADDPAWQVMVSTHSPQFIDPLRDHTTIVRLDRSDKNPTPRTFRSDDVTFTDDEKDTLKLLNRFDTGLAEMFFGQYPLLVEGDTEFAAFQHVMQSNPVDYPHRGRPLLVRARGKHTLALIVRMLTHFKVSFSILHDADWPKCRDGKANSAWTGNKTLHEELQSARDAGLRVVHRVFVPNFELAHLQPEVLDTGDLVEPTSKDKPWNMLVALKASNEIRSSVGAVFQELLSSTASEAPFDGDFEEQLASAVATWAQTNGVTDSRFAFTD